MPKVVLKIPKGVPIIKVSALGFVWEGLKELLAKQEVKEEITITLESK